MGYDLNVLSITRNGKILFTNELIKNQPKHHLEGRIFEVAFICKSGNPYFAYYVCPEYYSVVAGPGNWGSFEKSAKFDKFRSIVSLAIKPFLVNQLKNSHKLNPGREIISFSHNRKHTNVLAYVPLIGDWAPIQHNDTESSDAAERKVANVNNGRLQLSDVIAIDEISPYYGTTLLMDIHDIEPRKEDDGFDSSFLSL